MHRRQAGKDQASRETGREMSMGKEVDKDKIKEVGKEKGKVIRGESVRGGTRGGDSGDSLIRRESEESVAEKRSGGWRRGGGGGEDEGGGSTNSSMASRWRAAGGEATGPKRAPDGVRETHIGGREGHVEEGHLVATAVGGGGGAGGGGGGAGGGMLAAPAPATRARSYDVLTDKNHYQV